METSQLRNDYEEQEYLDELAEAWKLICPKPHWKGKICEIIPADKFEICKEACMFYTSTELKLRPISDIENYPSLIIVGAKGYWGGPVGMQ